MLREEDLRVELGRADQGGDFLRLVHVPSGIQRNHPGPLQGLNQHKLMQRWRSEIEAELCERGLTQHLIPDYRSKSRRQHRPA
jgi:hypothetical protein